MKFSRLGLINKNQLGFTLVELMLAMAISGVIIGGITTTIYQVVTGNLRTGNHMTAVRQAQEAGYWVSHDAHMAQNVELADVSVDDPDGTRFPFTLTWADWGSNEAHHVVYTLVDMPGGGLKNLQRDHSINGTTETTIIAQFIDPTLDDDGQRKTRCNYDDVEGKFTLTVTATVGTGSHGQGETRTYEIVPRASP
jgi:prepilin-type N-terminal cleavage/methylation domain-containing protein